MRRLILPLYLLVSTCRGFPASSETLTPTRYNVGIGSSFSDLEVASQKVDVQPSVTNTRTRSINNQKVTAIESLGSQINRIGRLPEEKASFVSQLQQVRARTGYAYWREFRLHCGYLENITFYGLRTHQKCKWLLEVCYIPLFCYASMKWNLRYFEHFKLFIIYPTIPFTCAVFPKWKYKSDC